MNYLKEINAFERWVETNYLPADSQLLWYKLIALFNRAGWPEWVTIDNPSLMSLIQVKREATFLDIRNRLIELGFIEYQKGKKGSPNKYKLISLSEKYGFTYEVQTEVQSVVNSVVQTEVETVVQTVDIYKYKQDINTNQNINNSSSSSSSVNGIIVNDEEEKIAEVVNCYLNNIAPTPSQIVYQEIKSLLSEVEPSVIIKAIEMAVMNNVRKLSYIKNTVNDWICRGLTTLSAVEPYLNEWERNKNKKNTNEGDVKNDNNTRNNTENSKQGCGVYF